MKYVKYRTQKMEVSYDGGETWEDTGERRKGEYLGVYDTAEDCANAIVPPHETVFPHANEGAKATLVLDDGTEFDLPQLGYIDEDVWGSGLIDGWYIDDYVLGNYDIRMSFLTGMTRSEKSYISRHTVKIIVGDGIRYVCEGIARRGAVGHGSLGFPSSADNTAKELKVFYTNLREVVLPEGCLYSVVDFTATQVSKIHISSTITQFGASHCPYYDRESTAPENCSSWSNTNSTVFTSVGNYIPSVDSNCILLMYGNSIPSTISPTLPNFTYVRDELRSRWRSAYLNGQTYSRRYYNNFFPLSTYNTDFREPNDNEKFVARLWDGSLYSIPIGNGIVNSGDVVDIRSKICDIKFGPGVTKINNKVFGEGNLVDSGNPWHHINLMEFNSNVDISNCDVTLNVNKVKINGTNLFTCITSACNMSESRPGFYTHVNTIYVPDEEFEAYTKCRPVNSSFGFDLVTKLRQMSRFRLYN